SRMVRKVYPLRPLDEIVGLIRRGCNAPLAILPLGEMSANRTCEFHNVCANANLWLRGYSPTEVQTSLRVSDDERHDKVRSSLTAFVMRKNVSASSTVGTGITGIVTLRRS